MTFLCRSGYVIQFLAKPFFHKPPVAVASDSFVFHTTSYCETTRISYGFCKGFQKKTPGFPYGFHWVF